MFYLISFEQQIMSLVFLKQIYLPPLFKGVTASSLAQK